MDVIPNEEEQMVKNLAREFLEAECPPSLARNMEKDEKGYPPDLWQKMAGLGWLGMGLPEQYGGQGLPLTYLGLILEEVGRTIAPVPLLSTVVPSLTIAQDGTSEQRQQLLPRISRGDLIMTWAVQEQDPRLLPETVRLEARAQGDGYLLSGTKMFVDNFVVAEKCLVAARTAPAGEQNQGISLFLVDTGSPGISAIALTTLAKDKQSKVTFDQVSVPASNLVGELNQGWPVVQRMLDLATALICAQMVGATRKDAEMAIEYAKNRVAFGRPIGAFQSIQHMCADMILWVDGGQLLTYEALWRMDQGLPASVEVSQAKAFCNDKCVAAVRTSQIIHGGMGFMMEFDLHLWYRRVTAWSMRLGTTFEHRARVSRALLDQPGPVRLGMTLVAVP
jgi:alkylation response protein AidB-like acyl-CoA dehydrogenase